MYIRNRSFSDEDTLLEAVFDFDLGNHANTYQEILDRVAQEVKNNEDLKEQVKKMEEEDGMELVEDTRLQRLSEELRSTYDSFEIYSACFYGIKNGERIKLSEVELV